MLFVIKTAKTIRNHWKKSVFATALISYGVIYTRNYFATNELMYAYCKKASKYGKQSIAMDVNPRHITVILNPNANKRKATEDFDKYCAPLLYLAGLSVDIKKTESEGHAKTIVDSVENTDAIVVAGGDGTLSEVVTGLLRLSNENTTHLVPLGVLPLGRSNSIAKSFFPTDKGLEKVRALAEATMAVIEETVKLVDVMKIEIVKGELEDRETSKPVYAVASLKWGAYRDAEAKKDSYWVFGPMRKYATYIFNGMKSNLSWNCEANIKYSIPCEGCSNCVKRIIKPQTSSWLQKFVKEDNFQARYLARDNPDCQVVHEKNISTADLALSTTNLISNSKSHEEIPRLLLEIGPRNVEYLSFVKNGFKNEKGGKKDVEDVIEAKTINIEPKTVKESWFSIDNESYEMKPVNITLLPKTIKFFCRKEINS